MRPKLLVLCSRLPYPLDRGDRLRMYFILRELKKHFETYCVALSVEDVNDEDVDEVEKIVDTLKVIPIAKSTQASNIARVGLSKLPLSVGLHHSAKARKEIANIVDEFQPDHIFCQLTRMAEYARHIQHPSKTIDYMDAFGEGMSRRASISTYMISKIYNMESKRMRQYEKEIYPDFHNHIVISEQDASLIGSDQAFDVVGNGIDCTYFKSQTKTAKYDIGFVGNMGYLPNVAAVEFLIKEVLPLHENYNILIAGARPHQRVKQLASDNVTITGWVDDIRSAYDDCSIFVAPIWSGTGQQNKILEAMAMGVPVVTTSSVNKAIGGVPDEHILIAENADVFHQQIQRLSTDNVLYNKIVKSALEFVKANFSWEEKGKKIIEVISNGI